MHSGFLLDPGDTGSYRFVVCGVLAWHYALAGFQKTMDGLGRIVVYGVFHPADFVSGTF